MYRYSTVIVRCTATEDVVKAAFLVQTRSVMITQNAEEFKIQLRNPYVKRLTPVFSRVTFEGLNEPFLERSIDENFGRNCESSELSEYF
jgi:hypothetical protein